MLASEEKEAPVEDKRVVEGWKGRRVEDGERFGFPSDERAKVVVARWVKSVVDAAVVVMPVEVEVRNAVDSLVCR